MIEGAPSSTSEEAEEAVFPVVAMGASAGGLESFISIFQNLPARTGMAFVLIQHMDPAHESLLSDLISRVTEMPVNESKDGEAIQPNRVYVIPPNVDMEIFHGSLMLMPRGEERILHKPIDVFLRSLAKDRGTRAVAIILSGTGSDGSQGLMAVKAEGGVVMAQEPDSAKYADMPRNAIATGHIDLVLPPAELAGELLRISQHPVMSALRTTGEDMPLSGEPDEIFKKVFVLLRNATGVDFLYYKQSTVRRRLARRMALHGINKLGEYLRYLQSNPQEVQALFKDMLINVTSFFRDPDQLEALKERVFPQIFLARDEESRPLRIWVPGCSTGEEAYSIAMCLQEYRAGLSDGSVSIPVQIFATDISEEFIQKARLGLYPEDISLDVSQSRLGKFFVQMEKGYKVNKTIRDMCVFAQHNVIADPPFFNIDLISCRNLLIYMSGTLQRRILPFFNYSLNPGGFLMLGTSESIGPFADLFALVDSANHIYSKKVSARRPHLDLGAGTYASSEEAAEVPGRSTAVTPMSPARAADSMIMARYAVRGVIVDQEMDITEFRGDTSRYLEHAPGQASLNLLAMAKGGLQIELRHLVEQARTSQASAKSEDIIFREEESPQRISIEVIPLLNASHEADYFLVLFEDVAERAPRAKGLRHTLLGKLFASPARGAENETLMRELEQLKQHLQSIAAERDSTVEALRSANEAVMSGNEELQSINEELETAKEELQSTNEELTTVNEELQERNFDLNQAMDDVNNLILSVNLPIIMLRGDLSIRRFTPTAQQLFFLQTADVGRSIEDIKMKFDMADLKGQLKSVLQTLEPHELELQDSSGNWYSMWIRPYRTVDNRIDGLVLTFLDITAMREELTMMRRFYEPIVETVREPLLVLDGGLTVRKANRSFYTTFLATQEETEGRLVFELGNGQWDIPRLRVLLQEILERDTTFDDFEIEHDFPRIGHQRVILNARRVYRENGGEHMILLALEVTHKPETDAD